MMIVGVLGASFSLRHGREPNPCNVRLAEECLRICDELIAEGHKPVLIVQWEIASALVEMGQYHRIYEEIGEFKFGEYLGTKEVYDEALTLFEEKGAVGFVGVAQPFIHQPYLYWLARKAFGERRVWKKIGKIGFDRESDQWWCRSWWQLTLKTLLIALTGVHGFNGRQAKA